MSGGGQHTPGSRAADDLIRRLRDAVMVERHGGTMGEAADVELILLEAERYLTAGAVAVDRPEDPGTRPQTRVQPPADLGAQHTPGPWSAIHPGAPNGRPYVTSRGPGVAALLASGAHAEGEIWANACLIAAAPALADALEGLLDLVLMTEREDPHPLAAARAALRAAGRGD